jgi:hypothetical protein
VLELHRTTVRPVHAFIRESVQRHGPRGLAGRLVGAVLACAILTLIAWNGVRLATGQVTASELACIDPTDPCNYSTYRVLNDTGTPVVLRECIHHCGAGDRRLDPVPVRNGTTTSGDAVTALVGSSAWWEVLSRSNRSLGCLVLDGHKHKRDGDLVRVSALGRCAPDAAPTPARAAPRKG